MAAFKVAVKTRTVTLVTCVISRRTSVWLEIPTPGPTAVMTRTAIKISAASLDAANPRAKKMDSAVRTRTVAMG